MNRNIIIPGILKKAQVKSPTVNSRVTPAHLISSIITKRYHKTFN